MIDQTIPLGELTAGMALCVREWILPHLTDPMARIQAEQLATLLERIPSVVAPEAALAIEADSAEACAMLEQLGAPLPELQQNDGSIDCLMSDNAALKRAMESLAEGLRTSSDPAANDKLVQLQQFFIRSATRELGGAVAGPDFQALTSRDREGRR